MFGTYSNSNVVEKGSMVEVPNETYQDYQVHSCGERGFDKLILARFDRDGSG